MSMRQEHQRVSILGVPIDNLTQKEALARLADFIATGTPHQVATINPEFIVAAWKNPGFAKVLQESDVNLADGAGLLWACRYLGQPLKERVTGTDTINALASLAAEKGWRIFFLGGQEGIAAIAAKNLRDNNPGLVIAGTYAGSPSPEEEEKIVGMVRKAKPHILLVAYGAPQQDLWIHRNLDRLRVPVAMGVGGALDYISGRVPRAPGWMRRRGLEWLFRLTVEPWRWRRMLALPYFVWLVLWSKPR